MNMLASVDVFLPLLCSAVFLGSLFFIVRPKVALPKFPGLTETTLRIIGVCGMIWVILLFVIDPDRNPFSLSRSVVVYLVFKGVVVGGLTGFLLIPICLNGLSKIFGKRELSQKELWIGRTGVAGIILTLTIIFLFVAGTFAEKGPAEIAMVKLSSTLIGIACAFAIMAHIERACSPGKEL